MIRATIKRSSRKKPFVIIVKNCSIELVLFWVDHLFAVFHLYGICLSKISFLYFVCVETGDQSKLIIGDYKTFWNMEKTTIKIIVDKKDWMSQKSQWHSSYYYISFALGNIFNELEQWNDFHILLSLFRAFRSAYV